jgi:phospholipid/cholesterol/gamma-HCH transport system permease protein
MVLISGLHSLPGAWALAGWRVLASVWQLLHFSALMLVVALTPATYSRANRSYLARHVHATVWEVLPWFMALSALLSLVLIRVVLVSAQSYGLSSYALEMVVRVLVLELIPLAAAMFVALRAGLPLPELLPGQASSLAFWREELVPRLFAGVLAVQTLALLSSAVALVQAYLLVHGLSPWGLSRYTRTVGHVFSPAVFMGFALKTLLFSLAVSLVPMAASLEQQLRRRGLEAAAPGMVRLFLVLLQIEAASLAIKYV